MRLNELAAKAASVATRQETYSQQCQAEEAFTMAADPETIAALVAEVKRWRAVREQIGALPSFCLTLYGGDSPRMLPRADVQAILDAAATGERS